MTRHRAYGALVAAAGAVYLGLVIAICLTSGQHVTAHDRPTWVDPAPTAYPSHWTFPYGMPEHGGG